MTFVPISITARIFYNGQFEGLYLDILLPKRKLFGREFPGGRSHLFLPRVCLLPPSVEGQGAVVGEVEAILRALQRNMVRQVLANRGEEPPSVLSETLFLRIDEDFFLEVRLRILKRALTCFRAQVGLH